MTAADLMLLYLGWLGVFVLSIIVGYVNFGRKRK